MERFSRNEHEKTMQQEWDKNTPTFPPWRRQQVQKVNDPRVHVNFQKK